MSTSVFTQCDGRVVTIRRRVDCGADNPSVFTITYSGGQNNVIQSLRVPVTGFALEQQGNYQFLHTINNFTYFYIFGDRIGELTVSGMGFTADAAQAGPTNNDCGASTNEGSVCNLYSWYNDNKASARGKAMVITLNSGKCGSLWGFLTGMRMELPRPDVLVAQWTLRFNVIVPPDATEAVGASGDGKTTGTAANTGSTRGLLSRNFRSPTNRLL